MGIARAVFGVHRHRPAGGQQAAALLMAWSGFAGGQAWAETDPSPAPAEAAEVEAADQPTGYTPSNPAAAQPSFFVNGYVDVGLAKAQGNGSSFAPNDTRVPADYGVDPFAPMVNARGDVASIDSRGVFTNGFLPRSMDIGDRTSFFVSTLDFDARYQPQSSPFMVFSRVQVLPRHLGDGNQTRVYVEQTFGRLTPLAGHEWNISVGKFDSVFGIEYLETQANIRTGITPSLMARYTTGTSVGAKMFVRQPIAVLWSALSLNIAATNSAPFVEALQPPDVSLTGRPNFSGRAGYELDLPRVQVKLGGSGLTGPRNDQSSTQTNQRMWGADARLNVSFLSVAGEYVHVKQDEGSGEKETGQGTFPITSGFTARGYYVFAALTAGPGWRLLSKVALYGRYGRRHAEFTGFRPVEVSSLTVGLRLDLGETVVLKGEILKNAELQGAPTVNNDVYTSSLVFSW